MAFRQWEPSHLAKFNSSASSEFLEFYENILDTTIREHEEAERSRSFSPSSFRCSRLSWFKLRGTKPDKVENPDRGLKFAADIGTACHRIIQNNLKEYLNDDWVDVADYLASIEFPYDYELTHSEDSLECLIAISDPPIRFACDGIIRWKDKYYLLEIKTSEFSSWSDLTDPKNEHIDQIKCYAALLNIHNVLFLYQDRQHGDFKCYEVYVSDDDMDQVKNRMKYILDMVDKNLAPEGLPKGDKWCSPNYCQYHSKCKEYGR